tara:strand:+ start:569 stop:1174 length:606 start_codon:yes stop_codon:yes gene_type:complete
MSDETKKKIMEATLQLFAINGVDGTSMRAIAKSAEVNLSAINYHFTSKENLCRAVISKGYERLEESIRANVEGMNGETFEATIIKMVDVLNANQTYLSIGFQVLLSHAGDFTSVDGDELAIGPPGGRSLLQCLTKEVGEDVPIDDRIWVISVIFNQISHFIMLKHSPAADIPELKTRFEIDHHKKTISRLVKALVSEIKNN